MGVLVVMCGMPCSGKSSVARAVARSAPAAYLSVDPVHDALRPFGVEEWDPLGKASYAVVRRLVVVQLKVGLSVVVDAVNPFETTRSDYQELAHDQQADFVLVHAVCTDEHLHRRRVEARHAGGNPVDWAEIERQAGYYEPPEKPDVIVDSANPVDSNVAEVLEHLRLRRKRDIEVNDVDADEVSSQG